MPRIILTLNWILLCGHIFRMLCSIKHVTLLTSGKCHRFVMLVDCSVWVEPAAFLSKQKTTCNLKCDMGLYAMSCSLIKLLKTTENMWQCWFAFIRTGGMTTVPTKWLQKECRLLACNTVKFGKSPMFRRNLSPPFSGPGMSHWRNYQSQATRLAILYLRDEDDVFLRNVGLSPNNTTLQFFIFTIVRPLIDR
jgi:hypothetical protein